MKKMQFVNITEEAEGIRVEADCRGDFLGEGTTHLLLSIYRDSPELLATILLALTERIEEEDKARKEMQKQLEEVLKNGF